MDSCETPGLTWVNALLRNVNRAIDRPYHACEANCTGRDLAEFWNREDGSSHLLRRTP